MLNSALLLLNAARLPRACAPAALPRGSDLSAPCQATLEFTQMVDVGGENGGGMVRVEGIDMGAMVTVTFGSART